MEPLIQASVDLHGSTLRYAEVERRSNGYALLKLGSCEFEVDMVESLLGGGPPAPLDVLHEALADVFNETRADELHLVVHPEQCYSFFTPLAVELSELERKERLQEEATMLTSLDHPIPLHLTADVVYSESINQDQTVEWFHVLGIKDQVYATVDRVFRSLPQVNFRLNLSTRGAARVMEAIETRERAESVNGAAFSLAIGFYDGMVEYTLCRHRKWFFSHHAQAGAPVDAAYFALILLKRLKLSHTSIRQLYVYGPDVSEDAFPLLENVFQTPVRALNPMSILEVDGYGEKVAADAYVPCIGVTL